MQHLFLYFLASAEPALAAVANPGLRIALMNSIWDRCGTYDSAGLKSQFGCGGGLICKDKDQWYSQCKPNSALNKSLWTSCPTSQLNVTGIGTPAAACAIGSYCDGNKWYAQCRDCRTKYTTCYQSAYQHADTTKCCPGIISSTS